MEIFKQALAFIDARYIPAFTVAVTLLSLLPKLVAPLMSALEAHDKHFVRKPMERLRALRSSVAKNPNLSHYLESSIELEAFRIASGVNTSRAKMEFLIALNKDGTWTKQQLRRLSQHVHISDDTGEPQLTLSGFDKFAALWSAYSAGVIALLGATFFVLLAIQGSLQLFTGGALTFAIFIAFARFILNDYISYKIARSAQTALARQRRNA
ncbi:hypothetical protein ACSVIJ_10750 [Pseudomonas sp. NCHU5208]|uniref:hypothetical protein n=1 Tax=unclassified Pseudomonas TaxID=196821 RepID=UPI003F96B275